MAQTVKLSTNRESEAGVQMAGAGTPSGGLSAPGADPMAYEESEVTAGPLGPVLAELLVRGSTGNDALRLLSSKVQQIDAQRPFRCIGVVSATAGEGKTVSAIGLAHTLAQKAGSRILLIEADLRRPSLEGYLSLPRVPGLGKWLETGRRGCPLRRLVPYGFCVLTAGHPGTPKGEPLGSERMVALLRAARSRFDYVIVDCAPLVPVADAVVLQDLLDGYLLVVRARHTPRETLLRAVSHLKPDRIRGVIFNDQHEILSRYHSYGYRPYGEY